MATALPSTGPTPRPKPDEPGCDTDDMFIVHGLLRSLFASAAGDVAGVEDGDHAHAEFVADHVAMVSSMLHHHHHTEDTLLWDELESRAPSCALHVGRMRQQHAEMAELIAELEPRITRWRASADHTDAAAVIDGITAISTSLDHHLGDEERNILPPASAAMSQRAWDRLGEAGRAATPRDQLFIQLGFILDSMPDGKGEAWMREVLPLPPRVLWKLVGRRQYAAYRARLRGDGGTRAA